MLTVLRKIRFVVVRSLDQRCLKVSIQPERSLVWNGNVRNILDRSLGSISFNKGNRPPASGTLAAL